MNKEQLIEEINKHNTAYAAGIPFISDEEYDQLWQQLHSIDPTNPILYHTAKSSYTGGDLIIHKYPVFGTNKAFNMEDLKPFLTRFGDQELVIEPKYDGCAAVITQGQTGIMITLEGDGKSGSDITHLIPYIEYPFHLRHFQVVEILIPWSDWNPAFGKNPRNTVAGWLARKYEKPPIKMTAIPHNFGNLSIKYTYNGNLNEFGEFLLETFSTWSETYPMDGIMIKVADEKVRLVAGNNGQTNNWSIAWKPPIQTKETTVVDIEWNVSRKGRIIPTIVYEPLELCGTTNQRVTGNNAQWLKDKQIFIGSKILVGKAGEIIPKILAVENSHLNISVKQAEKPVKTTPDGHDTAPINEKGSHTPQKIETSTGAVFDPLPTHCPKCNELLTWEGVHLICTGPKCITQLINSLEYFYSHKGIFIDGFGRSTFEKLLENQKVFETLTKKPWALLDISSYNISVEVFSCIGEKSFLNLMRQLTQIINNHTMAHFISALGLPGVGYRTALKLCQYIKSGKLTVPVSKKAMKSFFEGTLLFEEAKNEMNNFSFAPIPEPAKAIYCITGTLTQPREEMIKFFSDNGYEFSSNVTRTTNYLIVGENPGKIKIRYAEKYNIPQITEEQFIKLLQKEI